MCIVLLVVRLCLRFVIEVCVCLLFVMVVMCVVLCVCVRVVVVFFFVFEVCDWNECLSVVCFVVCICRVVFVCSVLIVACLWFRFVIEVCVCMLLVLVFVFVLLCVFACCFVNVLFVAEVCGWGLCLCFGCYAVCVCRSVFVCLFLVVLVCV